MSNSGKGKRGRPRNVRRTPTDPPADNGRSPDSDWQGGDEDYGGGERNWRRNLRRREPSTPENSWLATQPEFQRYWGEANEADPEPPMPPEQPSEEPPNDPYAAPKNAPQPRPRSRRKPADLSTLMARYTARVEEQESFALAPPARSRRAPPPEAPVRTPGPADQRQGQVPPQGPAPARKKASDPKFVASPLPAEMPEVEPGRAARADRSGTSRIVGPAPAGGSAPGSIIVSDGQVTVVEAGETTGEDEITQPALSSDESTEIPDPHHDPLTKAAPEDFSHGATDHQAPYPPSDTAQTHNVPLPAGDTDVGWQDQESGPAFDGHKALTPEPPVDHYEQDNPLREWPSEPGGSTISEPVRFDGPLPYQDQSHGVEGAANLADWDAANERLEFEPAWHANEGGMGFGRKFLLALFLLGAAGAGYVAWSGKTTQLVDFASTFLNAPGPVADQGRAPVDSRAPDAATGDAAPVAGVTPPAAPAPAATTTQPEASTVTLAPASQDPAAPALAANPGERVAPDPNMKTRQIEGPAPQTTTLWWKPKTVTLFPALTPAELAGQPEPPSARGEAVMAPSRPLTGAAATTGSIAPADAAEIARIDELIQSYAIKNAEDSIAPLLASAPGNPAYLMLSGRTALAKSSNLQALATFEKALAADPDNADAKTARGRALVNLGRATEAQTIAAEVLAENPGHLGALWLSVEAQSTTGALQAALEICGRLESAGAEPGSAEWCRGVANKRARRPLQAETLFADALQSGTRDFISMRQLYFRFKGYFNGAIDGFSSDQLIAAATRCSAVRDCNTAGL